MELDEAIRHCLERANQDCSECANEHRQLADWLMELKCRRAKKDTLQHGHWVIYPTLFSFLRCSQCHNGLYWHKDNKPNYCLYCGAKMDGDSHDLGRV